MRAGKMNRRITVQTRPTPTRNNYGEPEYTWKDTFSLWAAKITKGGGEFFAAQKINAKTEAVYTVRYTDSISTDDRIIDDGATYEILHLNDVDGKKRELQIAVSEVK